MLRRITGYVMMGAAVLLAPLLMAQSKSAKEAKPVKILRQTPILIVDAIEPHLEFYEKRLGYKRLAEVPHGGRLGFIMLEQNENHVMMQTRSSMADDLGGTAGDPASRETLLRAAQGNAIMMFVVVESIDAVIESMKGIKQLVPLRTTNYGMKEIVVQDHAGFVLVFAQEIAPSH